MSLIQTLGLVRSHILPAVTDWPNTSHGWAYMAKVCLFIRFRLGPCCVTCPLFCLASICHHSLYQFVVSLLLCVPAPELLETVSVIAVIWLTYMVPCVSCQAHCVIAFHMDLYDYVCWCSIVFYYILCQSVNVDMIVQLIPCTQDWTAQWFRAPIIQYIWKVLSWISSLVISCVYPPFPLWAIFPSIWVIPYWASWGPTI